MLGCQPDKHESNYGLSFILLKKELLVELEQHGLPGLVRKVRTITRSYENTGWAMLCNYLYDVIDPTFEPRRAMSSWLAAGNARLRSGRGEWVSRLVVDDILTQCRSDSALAATFVRFSGLSLLDLAVQLWRKYIAHPQHALLEAAFRKTNASIAAVLRARFTSLEITVPHAYTFFREPPSDVEIYRTSFFFDDIASVIVWRCHVNRLIVDDQVDIPGLERDETTSRINAAASSIVSGAALCGDAIATLRSWEHSFLVPGSESGDQKFLTAAVIAQILRSIAAGERADPKVVAFLIAVAEDVQRYLSPDTLRVLRSSELATDSPLLRFMLTELIYRQSRTPDNELERRLAFMDILADKSNADIVGFLDQIANDSLEIATLLARTCTRTFLERLYMLMSTVKEVIETRLNICRWLSRRAGAVGDRLTEECDALERELANLEIRSDLDSTRVHVDEESLREWFRQTESFNAVRYVQTVLAEGRGTNFGSLVHFFSSREKTFSDEQDLTMEAQVGSEFLLLGIFDATFRAFASDRIFGLDAYLSRRIRHGTLSGHVITPVTRVLKRLSEIGEIHEEVYQSGDVSCIEPLAQDWRKFLVSELDHVRREVIQLKTPQHPDGLVKAAWRTPANIAHLDAMVGRVRRRVIETAGGYDIFPDIYALCWDCIEPDLAQLRRYMLRVFLPRATEKLDSLLLQLSPAARRLTSSLIRELISVLEARIQEVCGWFILPVFRRDSYSLEMLITSTLSIVRELDEHYSFTEEVVISDQISLNRGSFEVFGDALFVLIGNAARHGKNDGRIRVRAEWVKSRNDLVLLNVTSEVSSAHEHKLALGRIKCALIVRREHMERAAVEEGFSGLGKLAGVLRRVRSPDVRLVLEAPESECRITFWLTLPSEITFGARVQ
jgi:hypothetical protein